MFLFQSSPPQVPRPRRENHEPESPLPHAVKSEIAQLTSKFTVDYANEGDDGCEQTALVCSISESVFYRIVCRNVFDGSVQGIIIRPYYQEFYKSL